MSDTANPQWKPWIRWPFLLIALTGVAMIVIGVRECIALVDAFRTLPPEIVVNTAMSAFPPLGVGFVALGGLAWMPRTADGRNLRPVRIGQGGERDPGVIVVGILLICLLLYPIAGLTLRAVTANMLSARGYSEKIERVSPSSGYITMRWTR